MTTESETTPRRYVLKARRQSRAQRWAEALGEAREALSALDAAYGNLEESFSALQELHSEYEEWKDNMPENLANSPTAEKLEAVCELDFEKEVRDTSYSDLESLLDEAEAVELPVGFGRD